MDGLDRIAERKHARTPGARDRNIGNDDLKCTYRCVVLPDNMEYKLGFVADMSQCTYRCVVLPDLGEGLGRDPCLVSMHLQVRGAP